MKSDKTDGSAKNVVRQIPCDIGMVTRLRAMGNRYYMSIRNMDVQYFGLKTGDLVHFKIDSFEHESLLKETNTE